MIQAIAIALTVNWLIVDLAYWEKLNKFAGTDFFDRKPFNCTLCFAFWGGVGVLVAQIVAYGTGDWYLPPVASALAVWIEQVKYRLGE